MLKSKNNDININKDKKRTVTTTSTNAYPISINNQQCVGPCYYSNTKIIHPLTLDEIKGVEHNFCPVNAFVYVDPVTKKNALSVIDRCYVPTARETPMDELLRENIIAPQFHFSSDYFVKIYYKINNLEDLLRWLDNHSNDPFRTRERVFNNGMVAYGDQITIIDHRMINFVNDIMINNLPKLYRYISPYIIIQGDEVTFRDGDKYSNNNDHKENKESEENEDDRKKITIVRNYIKDKFLGPDNIQQFMSKFIRYYKEEITDRYISTVLVNHMIDYTIKRIKLTLES